MHICTAAHVRRALLLVTALALALLVIVTGQVAPARAATSYTSYVTYASAPKEVIGVTPTGHELLTAREAAAVPASKITAKTSQFFKVRGTGALYRVSGEVVTALTVGQWTYAGTPTPRLVDRVPAREYYSYASAPQEVLIRTAVGVWRKPYTWEKPLIPLDEVIKRTKTFYVRDIGSTQVRKRINGVETPISDDIWKLEGAPTPMVEPVRQVGSNPFTAGAPYADPTYPSVAVADQLRAAGNRADAAALDKISAHAGARWVGSGYSIAQVGAVTSQYVTASLGAGSTGVLVVYGIPGRDCGSHSAGGFTAADYPLWIDQIAAGIGGRRVAVVLEPDALLQLGRCAEIQGDRTGLLRYATHALTEAGATVYIDGATFNYGGSAQTMADRLLASGVQEARGFAVNVSGYKATADVQSYADEVSRLLGGKHYVIDTSRNGVGSNGEWCNARDRAVGALPGLVDHGNQDAALWIKTIGASDGICNGGPAAGTWWTEIALELVRGSTTL